VKTVISKVATPAGAIGSFATLVLGLFVVIVWKATEGEAWALVGIGLLIGFVLLTLGAGIAMMSQHVNAKQDERLMMVNFKENTGMLQQQFKAQQELAKTMMLYMRGNQMMTIEQPDVAPPLPELPADIFDEL